jgi:putative ATP-dependent DNA ligase
MNPEIIADKLGIPIERLDELWEGVVRKCDWPEPHLWRFEKAASGIETGTVFFDNDEVVFGYPKIRRAMMLSPAIRRRFSDRVAVQEKMNGYNVRVTSIDGNIIALTRGGFICPYSTEVAREKIDSEIFAHHPEQVLCGEMVGPNNPYVPKEVYPTESLEFYLFDLALKDNKGMLGVARTNEFAKKHGITCVPFLGEFAIEDAALRIMEIVKRLGEAGREGVVIKDPGNEESPLKYTSSESTCSDLQFAFKYYNDYAQDFFFSRVIREGFQSVEWGESEEERKMRSLRLGESILAPMVETIRKRMECKEIVQDVQIKVKDLQTAWEFEHHLKRMGVKAIFSEPESCDEGYLVKITRLVMSTNDKTKAIIDGEPW